MAIQGDLAQILSGMPIRVAGCNIAVSQPTIREISAYGEDVFLGGLQIFVKIDKIVAPIKEGNSRLAMLPDFQVLIAALKNDTSIKETIDNLFSLILPEYSWEFAPGSINFRIGENASIIGQINPMNFENFQKTLSTLFLPQRKDKEEQEFNPANSAAEEIAKKLQKGRDQRAAIQQKEKGDIGSIFANYASVIAVGLSMDINTIYNYTPFQLYDIFTRYTVKMAYDLHVKVSTTPFMDTSKMDEPKNWLESIYQ